jgi:hypothetical protein
VATRVSVWLHEVVAWSAVVEHDGVGGDLFA